jgi:4-hydroxybutyryl-CoA dehydratase/vinylacetyl-CoA-Delta-isomerase
LVIGIAALVAQVNGLPMKGHIRDKLTRMMMQAETAQGCALGAAVDGEVHPSGVYIPNTTITNAGLNFIKNVAGEQIQLLHDISGGIIVTMPSEDDYKNPTIRKWMDEYLRGHESFTTEERLRVLYLAQELAGTKFTGNFLGWAINASGSPITGKILTRKHYDLEKRIRIAKKWAKVEN